MNPIKQFAHSLGFDACGIAPAEALTEDAAYLQQWLQEGKQGDMHYLERNFDKRIDPRLLVPGCKSIVVVLMNYFPGQQQNPSALHIAKYSYPEYDYHLVVKTKLKELEQKICVEYGRDSINSNVQHLFVDSAPLLERRWAERAGLGWIGKHTQLINPGIGSYCFIGILILSVDLPYDTPVAPRCGSCTRCMDACPTQALTNGILDARRCISYLTIESKNEIPPKFQSQLSGNILGCDICADVCPWNIKLAKPHDHTELSPANNILDWEFKTWQKLTKDDFNEAFKHSAIKRAGFEKLKQNIEINTKTKLTP